ncbi:MAG: hypothetical protein ACRC4T_16495 [Cetobacterium sp.]
MENKSSLVSKKLELLDNRFERRNISDLYFQNEKYITLINVINKNKDRVYKCETVEIRYNKAYISITNSYKGKFLGDLDEGKMTIDKEFKYSDCVHEEIRNYILEKYFE